MSRVFTIERLDETLRAALVAHLLALPVRDRSLRFGRSLAPGAITAYVDGIDFRRDAVFGAHDDSLLLVGAAHVAVEHDLAEVGLSVLPAHRRRGVGSALFERAVTHVRTRCIPRLLMHFLTGNVPVMRMARRFGMDIVTAASEADAYLKLRAASVPSITGVTDTFAP